MDEPASEQAELNQWVTVDPDGDVEAAMLVEIVGIVSHGGLTEELLQAHAPTG
jgi:hypothetical protein